MTGKESVKDNAFDMDVNGSSTRKLTPVVTEQRTTPSPTGYRDYKPPAEVLSNNYGTTFYGNNDDYDNARSNFKRDQPKEDDFAHKTILLGDSGVGKTSLLVQFDTGNFQPGNFAATVGIGFTNKVVTVDETKVKLQIWDTAGQERFRSVTHAYYRDAHALLLLYDVTNKTSFDNIRAWLSEIREHANEDVVIMLLGNKSDCRQERMVKKEDGERLAQEYKVPFMETSAKTGLNVELAFLAVARELKARKSSDPDDTKFNVQDYVRQQSKKNSCFNSNCLTT
ncbi:PREDICTED: ras-related protein Rab-37-like isoform X2 [Polistes dominula]|uniref:Ras-related protein Rab-37-like isoform X2 n=1 Tax=Polistes dominula TaxID=743375 RepID=A0ABM1IJ00_POLDO|nr:PREDICTED: ras-related protein Rab-37-like isoform X2 [Polistes dominula]XP_015180188.1 PREDICTED: ras-related protein Rab-37-like isoform X2 [Polistes dominula]XP_015180189.1 PREDICTED: ras-related protein Rab-37-like isoform X2 [Polistes dominula]